MRTKFDDDLEEKIKWLHTTTTEEDKNKWNKAKFSVTPDGKFDMEFIWDQEWQDEIDGYNQQAEKEDTNYKAPKWHWEG
ncbi:MAG TPA: immunity protein YezG family protein [Cytophagaceae bacterium]